MREYHFKKGNRLYQLVEPKTKVTSDEMIEGYADYANFVFKNPIKKQEVVRIGNNFTKTKVNACRPLTIQGYCNWLGIDSKTFREYEAGKFDHIEERLSLIASRVRGLVESYQYDHAAAGLLSQSIVARMLGLADKRELTAAPTINVVDMRQAKNITKNTSEE